MEKVIVCIKNGAVIDVIAPENVDVYIRDYDTPIAINKDYIDDEKVALYNVMVDEDGDEYVEEIW